MTFDIKSAFLGGIVPFLWAIGSEIFARNKDVPYNSFGQFLQSLPSIVIGVAVDKIREQNDKK